MGKKNYYKIRKDKQRELLQHQYKEKWRTYLTNVEYMLWCINAKEIDPVKHV